MRRLICRLVGHREGRYFLSLYGLAFYCSRCRRAFELDA